MPDFAAAQAQQLKADKQSELHIAFSTDIAKPDRYKLDISEKTISFGRAADLGRHYFYLVDLNQYEESDDSSKADSPHSTYTYKSPTAAFVIGFIPGFCIHGLGHAYIGKEKTALVLFGIQVISIALTLAAIGYRQKRMDEGFRVDDAAAESWLLAALALFFGSWMYDFTAAPDRAHRMNEQANKSSASRAALSIDAGIKDNQARLVISLRW